MAADVIYVHGESSVLCSFTVPLPPHIQGRLDKGDLVRVNEDGSPWAPAAGPEAEQVPAADGPLPDGAPRLPKRSASRHVWTEFAKSQGMDAGEAATKTRDELVAEFTRESPGES